MHGLAEEFPALEGYYPQPKKLLLSEFLSYQGLTGIYSPLTVEANYNGDMTAYNIPFTTCHELSHLRGFMQEAEPDLEANSAFWDAYEGRISEVAAKINDTYLKANGQADGVQSYSRMVDLIVAYFG